MMSAESEKKTKLKKQKLRNNEYYDMQTTFDGLYQKSKKGENFPKLMGIITKENNILLAYRNIKNNDGSVTPGVDGKTIDHYKEWSEEKFVKYFQNRLIDYQPQAVRRVEIPKAYKPGETRPLGIPCMDDRITQQCIKQVLEPICEAKFHNHSYGFRPNRSTSHAIARTNFLMNRSQVHYIVDIDIKGFFDSVNHGKLLKQMWTMGIQDKKLLNITSRILKSEIAGIGQPNKGTPQGGIISPLLSNIVLNELDWWLSNQFETKSTQHKYSKGTQSTALKKTKLKEFYFVRYADDFKVLCRNYQTAQRIYKAIRQWLIERLGLEISPEKSKITNVRKGKTQFLGFSLFVKKNKKLKKHTARSNIADKAKKAIMEKYKEQIKKIQRHTIPSEVNQLNAMILGWHNYYNTATLCNLDFKKIAFKVSRSLRNRLKGKTSNKEPPTSKTYQKFYGKNNYATPTIAKARIFPIADCSYKKAMNFSQEICNYTETGRKKIHDKLTCVYAITLRLLRQESTLSVQYNDNRISLIAGQQGKCAVTHELLNIGQMECHHIIPTQHGGTDEYKNLMWLNANVHKLIHATKQETIDKYLGTLNLDAKALKKVNSLRLQTQNLEIVQVN